MKFELWFHLNNNKELLGTHETEEDAQKSMMWWLENKSRLTRWKDGVFGVWRKNGSTFIDYGAYNACYEIKRLSK